MKKQVGLRIVIEALCGGKFADLVDPALVHSNNDSSVQAQKAARKLQARLRKYEERLQTSRPVLVGHNFLYDLCFLYDTFIGPLPKTWAQFKARILEHFPRIIDTKVLALQDNPIEGGDPLEDLYKRWDACKPVVEWKGAAHGYGHKAAAHSAGYDSRSLFLSFPLPTFYGPLALTVFRLHDGRCFPCPLSRETREHGRTPPGVE